MGNPWFNESNIDFEENYKRNTIQYKSMPASIHTEWSASFLYQGSPEQSVTARDLVGKTIWVQDRSEEIIFHRKDLSFIPFSRLKPSINFIKILPRFFMIHGSMTLKGDTWEIEVLDTTSETWWVLQVKPTGPDELSKGLWISPYKDNVLIEPQSSEAYWKPYKILDAKVSPKSIKQLIRVTPDWYSDGFAVPSWSAYFGPDNLPKSSTDVRPAMINFEPFSFDKTLNWNLFPTSFLRGVSS
jgi:hypothetical protein